MMIESLFVGATRAILIEEKREKYMTTSLSDFLQQHQLADCFRGVRGITMRTTLSDARGWFIAD